MGGVFVNYRTGDGDWAAALIARELAAKFGQENVFYASKSIQVGEDFTSRILQGLRQCKILLVVIGQQWLTKTDRQGLRRLDNPEDWVRREIIEAFTCGLRVIPVFLDSTEVISERDLPGELASLARCQYLRLHHRNDDRDVARLLDEVGTILDGAVPVVPWLKQALVDPGQAGAIREAFETAVTKAVDAVAGSRYPVVDLPDEEIPAALEERLVSYAHSIAPLLKLVVAGIVFGDSERWPVALTRLLNRPVKRSTRFHEPWGAAAGYPALLLLYGIGVAAMSAGRDDIVYRALMEVEVKSTGDTALRALALRHVVDPRIAAAFPDAQGLPHRYALSHHLRLALRPAFDDLLGDRDYAAAFEQYEYLRSLLELHYTAFSSLGEFAFYLAENRTAVHERMKALIVADSALLNSGAFGGAMANVTAARQELESAVHGRYSR
ncbi:toll/interleukin-1 receptor domain-containing protein [Kibdelosporangium philippinense]|uniref:Toll/interleukin-1 receptor domain-containing protein n=1 Tax=Kibdelosporangium philippinense TaxID=211113 RepID=A0ABS8Z7T0_9PSEU|nr:toll/interleukin-1 receptor domain-containing protein [Kibdelosporangium philippinense]MCE7003457.1 toll/interleukin-1 receptor domain-containing protein [Kibdelosporangium philippinense]